MESFKKCKSHLRNYGASLPLGITNSTSWLPLVVHSVPKCMPYVVLHGIQCPSLPGCEYMWLINSCQLHLSGVRCCMFHQPPNTWEKNLSFISWVNRKQPKYFPKKYVLGSSNFSLFLKIQLISALIFPISSIKFNWI